jgi:hypothetical protein
MEAFSLWAAGTEKAIAELANPGVDFESRVTKGWLLTRLDHALIVLACYAILVVVGIIRYTPPKKEEKTKETFYESIQREPIKILQIVYNLVQVRRKTCFKLIQVMPLEVQTEVYIFLSTEIYAK